MGHALNDQVWAEQTGGIVIAKLRGLVSPALLDHCQQQVADLLGDMTTPLVLYDALELRWQETPWLPATQPRGTRAEVRGAIVLAEARLRNPLRLALGIACGEHRLFDGDLDAAYAWLAARRQPMGSWKDKPIWAP